jgi:transcriptional regulator with XRE-family HTH domain
MLEAMKVDGELAKRTRLEKALALSEVAHTARIDAAQLSKVERGLGGLSMASLRRLAAALELKPTDLYFEKLPAHPAAVPATATAA